MGPGRKKDPSDSVLRRVHREREREKERVLFFHSKARRLKEREREITVFPFKKQVQLVLSRGAACVNASCSSDVPPCSTETATLNGEPRTERCAALREDAARGFGRSTD